MRTLFMAVLTMVLVLIAQAPLSSPAYAQMVGCGTNALPGNEGIPQYCDQGIAFSGCMAAQDEAAAQLEARYPGSTAEKWGCPVDGANHYRCYVRIAGVTESNCSARNWMYRSGETCASRNANKLADAAPWYMQPPKCIGGCAVQGTSFSVQSGGVNMFGMKDRTYNGDVCRPAKPSQDITQPTAEKEDAVKQKAPECTALGSNQTACVKPNGDTCATSSTGKTFCWEPNETGKKTDATDGQVKSPKGEAVTPPDVNISDKEWQRKEGHQQTACINDRCITYNVTNFESVPGGTAKNSTGDNNADGSGNTSGNGKPGTGSSDDGKDGDKDSAADSGNCTVAPMCTGDTLKCLHLKFTWKTQCNTTQNEITKGSTCDAGDVPVCTGNSCKAEQYAQLLQQWRTRCNGEALQKGVEGLAGTGDGDDGKGSILLEEKGDGPKLNEGLVAYGGGSGGLGYDFEIEGQKFQMPQQVLDFLPVLRMLIIAAATLVAISIIRGS